MNNMMGMWTCTPADRITKATVTLQKEKPFFSYILMNFSKDETKPSSKCPTMAVNKYGQLYWGEGFVKMLDDPGLQFVLCHEVMHIAKGDFFRMGLRDPYIWNIAADLVINDMLNQEGFHAPKISQQAMAELTGEKINTKKNGKKRGNQDVGLVPDHSGRMEIAGKTYRVRDKTTEALYDELMDDAQQIKMEIGGAGEGDGEGQDGEGGGHGGFDHHMPGDQDSEGKSTGKEGENGSEASAASQAAQSKWEKVAVEAATVSRQAGKESGMIDDLIGKLLDPVVDWRQRLKEMVTSEIPVDFNTRLPGRSFYVTGAWAPQTWRENVSIFISVDASGSTSHDRQRFVSECYGILQAHPQVKARIILWDTNVDPANDVELTTETADDLSKMNIVNACGGTEFSSYTDYLDEKGYDSRVHIVLTDGYIEQNPRIPNGNLIFVLCRDSTDSIVKDYGEVLWLTDEDPDYDMG